MSINTSPRLFILMDKNATANYLGFGAEVVEYYGKSRIVAVLPEHAEWQVGRLQSGMALRGYSYHYISLEDARRAEDEFRQMDDVFELQRLRRELDARASDSEANIPGKYEAIVQQGYALVTKLRATFGYGLYVDEAEYWARAAQYFDVATWQRAQEYPR